MDQCKQNKHKCNIGRSCCPWAWSRTSCQSVTALDGSRIRKLLLL